MILAFSILFGELTAMVFSRMKPECRREQNQRSARDCGFACRREDEGEGGESSPSSRYESVNFPPTFLMIWMFSKSVDPCVPSHQSRKEVSSRSLSSGTRAAIGKGGRKGEARTLSLRTASTARLAK